MPALVAVPGVGDKAARAKGDFQIDALKGNEFCSVSVGSSDTVPGVAALQEAANDTSDIPESANAIIANALGTVCNRLFEKGDTTFARQYAESVALAMAIPVELVPA